MRKLSETFMRDLTKPDGMLHPLLGRVKRDHTLMLAIRDNYINIYYRGGNILKVSQHNDGFYQTSFDDNYDRSMNTFADSHADITARKDMENLLASFSERKNVMDEYFSADSMTEREFQQLITRENNFSSVSNESEYFIVDIEVAEPGNRNRIDMLAIRWRAAQRKNGDHCRAALIEMKYSDRVLSGSASLLKHLKDMDALIADEERYAGLIQTMEIQFDQLDQLGLLNFNKGKSRAKVRLSENEKPEVIFILANHNPRSTKLRSILDEPEMDDYAHTQRFDLRFFTAKFAGYGMHTDCMLSLKEFRELL